MKVTADDRLLKKSPAFASASLPFVQPTTAD